MQGVATDQLTAYRYLITILQKALSNSDQQALQKYQLLKHITLSKLQPLQSASSHEQTDRDNGSICALLLNGLEDVAALFSDFQVMLEKGQVTRFVGKVQDARMLASDRYGIAQNGLGHVGVGRAMDAHELLQNVLDKFSNLAKLIEIQNKLASVIDLSRERQKSLRFENQQLRQKSGFEQDSLQLRSDFFQARNTWNSQRLEFEKRQADLKSKINNLSDQLQIQSRGYQATLHQHTTKTNQLFARHEKIDSQLQSLRKFKQQYDHAFSDHPHSHQPSTLRLTLDRKERTLKQQLMEQERLLQRAKIELASKATEKVVNKELRVWSEQFKRKKGQVQVILEALGQLDFN